MSTEPAKKRGRPRKVALATVEATTTPQAQGNGGTKDTKQSSRKATKKTSTDPKRRKSANTAKSDTDNNSPIDTQAIAKSDNIPLTTYENSKILQELAARACTATATSSISPNTSSNSVPAHLPSTPPTPLNISGSPILQQAANLSSKSKPSTASNPTSASKSSTSSKAATNSRKTTSSTPPKPTNNSSKSSDIAKPVKTPSPSTTPKASKPSLPSAKEINASIVNILSARPGPGSGAAETRKPLAPPIERSNPRYKAALRRWTSIIVGLPIAIVTSWVLYERLVLGKDKSSFENVGLSDVKKAVQRLGMVKEEQKGEGGESGGEVKTEGGQ